jgi:hypothetical protein
LALRLAELVGFQKYDRKADAGIKNGVPFDLVMTDIIRKPPRAALLDYLNHHVTK